MTYTYEVHTPSNFGWIEYGATDNWQTAIDMFNEGKMKGSCEIQVTDLNANPPKVEAYLTNLIDVEGWSEHLMSTRRSYNRIEKRIMNAMMEQEKDGMEIVKPEFNEYGYYGENNGPLPEFKPKEESTTDFHGDFKDMDASQQDEIINPKHYKMIPKEAYVKHPEGLEYMDLMDYILAHHNGVESHLLGQVFKYACRLGKKDADLQDAKKIEWYSNRLVQAIKERS